jgi:hypothetical protein
MAKDLIPPPSPAGRPEPESSASAGRIAAGLWSVGETSEHAGSLPPPDGEPAPATPAPAVESPYRSRFGFALGALIGVALAAVGLGAMLALNASDSAPPDRWSNWRPTTKDDLGLARQIAEHVGPRYRLADANQLVRVQSSALEIEQHPLAVVMRTSALGGDIRLIEGHGLMYTLNGLGRFGSIPGGKPSEARHLLLRREALELSLYTFHYADDVDMVVTLLPPPPPKAGEEPPLQAMLYRPGDLRGELAVPLDATVPSATPRPEQLERRKTEVKRIQALTDSNLFRARFQRSQDAGIYLVLER